MNTSTLLVLGVAGIFGFKLWQQNQRGPSRTIDMGKFKTNYAGGGPTSDTGDGRTYDPGSGYAPGYAPGDAAGAYL